MRWEETFRSPNRSRHTGISTLERRCCLSALPFILASILAFILALEAAMSDWRRCTAWDCGGDVIWDRGVTLAVTGSCTSGVLISDVERYTQSPTFGVENPFVAASLRQVISIKKLEKIVGASLPLGEGSDIDGNLKHWGYGWLDVRVRSTTFRC